jgi:hypothetical protein
VPSHAGHPCSRAPRRQEMLSAHCCGRPEQGQLAAALSRMSTTTPAPDAIGDHARSALEYNAAEERVPALHGDE